MNKDSNKDKDEKNNIATHEADINLVKKFLDYANVADASYALLEAVNGKFKDIDNEGKEREKEGDKQNLGDKFNNHNSTYARAIEARFNEDRTGDWCIPFANKCLTEKDKISNNDITQVKLDSKLSKRTITFTNRFKLLKHQENTSSGFSATLFEDTEDNNQKIFAIRGTEFPSGFSNDVLDSDANLALSSLPSNQYIDMIKFYTQCIADKHITESTPLIITGHSLGGALAQLLTLSLATSANANNVKEVYTFNSPGAKNLKIDEDNLGKVYTIDSTILAARDKERALFKKIRGYEYGEKGMLESIINIKDTCNIKNI